MTFRWGIALGAVAGLLTLAGSSFAEPVTGDFTVQRFDPAPGPRNFVTVRGARTDGNMTWSAGAFLNFAKRPFVLKSCASETDCSNPNPLEPEDVVVVRNLFTFDALASLTVIPRLQLGLKVPLTLVSGEGLARGDKTGVPAGSPEPDGLSAFGMGDAMLEGKFRLANDPNDVVVPGVALFVTGPLGTLTAKNDYIGDRTPTAGLRGIIDVAAGPILFGVNLAGVYRGESTIGSTKVGSELRYGVAAGYAINKYFRALVEGFGADDFRSNNPATPLEVDLAVQGSPPSTPLTFTLGGGFNVLKDIGVPEWRVFLGAIFAPMPPADADGDGVPDDRDQCPKEKGDEKAKQPGCPKDKGEPPVANEVEGALGSDTKQPMAEPDFDHDGIPDTRDACRKDPEDKDGYKDDDGCPDPDNDKDGIPDVKDKCPDQPETMNGFEDDDGCPDAR